LAGIEAILAELEAYDSWTQTLFMLSASSWLEGEAPLVVLRRGELEKALTAARLVGEQTAA
jgi:hypothetical protein